MTDLSAEMPLSGPVIKAFGPSGFRIGDDYYNRGVILTPDKAQPWDAPIVSELTFENLMISDIIEASFRPEFLLLGTGLRLVRPLPKFVRELEAMDIGVEVMDSKAAARAWGVLRLEERQIISAIMPLA